MNTHTLQLLADRDRHLVTLTMDGIDYVVVLQVEMDEVAIGHEACITPRGPVGRDIIHYRPVSYDYDTAELYEADPETGEERKIIKDGMDHVLDAALEKLSSEWGGPTSYGPII